VAAKGTTDCAWLPLKAVITLLTTSQASALLLEICHTDSGEGRCGVVLGLVLVNLMNWDGGVDD
jgi:hypothetical protein